VVKTDSIALSDGISLFTNLIIVQFITSLDNFVQLIRIIFYKKSFIYLKYKYK